MCCPADSVSPLLSGSMRSTEFLLLLIMTEVFAFAPSYSPLWLVHISPHILFSQLFIRGRILLSSWAEALTFPGGQGKGDRALHRPQLGAVLQGCQA